MQAVTAAAVIATLATIANAEAPAADPLRPDSHSTSAGPRLRKPLPPPPKPAKDIAVVGETLAGSWTCTGAVTKLDITVALDNAWIDWRVTGGAGTTLSFRTFDGVAKQWTMIELTSATTHREAASLGADAKGIWTWQIDDAHREHEQLVDPKKLELWGERRSGTAWAKSYAATCTR